MGDRRQKSNSYGTSDQTSTFYLVGKRYFVMKIKTAVSQCSGLGTFFLNLIQINWMLEENKLVSTRVDERKDGWM